MADLGNMEFYRMGFLDGFQMGFQEMQKVQEKNGGIQDAGAADGVYSDDVDGHDKVLSIEKAYAAGYDDNAFVKITQNKNGKRLNFSTAGAKLLGNYPKADVFVRDGKLFIYPTNEGQYSIVRAPSSGSVQICCSKVIDELSCDTINGRRYGLIRRDNHLVGIDAA